MMKNIIIIVLCIFITTGCTNRFNKETVTFSTWGSTSEIKILNPIIEEFERKNPKINIELMHIPQNYFQKIHLLFASKLAPDVVFVNNLNIPVYANYLEPITPSKAPYYHQAIESLSCNGILYAVPRDVSTLIIYYNKDMFDKMNVPYPSPDWTIDELLETANALTTDRVYGISYIEDLYYVIPYLSAFHESIYPFDNVQNLKGLKFYKELVTKHKVAPSEANVGSKTLGQMFLEESLAMHLSGRWLTPKYKESAKFRLGTVVFPAPVPCDASGWAISKQSHHKKSAMKLIKFLSSKENIAKMTSSGLIIPARIDVPFDDNTFKKSVKDSTPISISPYYNRALDVLNDNVFLNK